MNLQDTIDIDQPSRASGAMLRRMECGCLTFTDPIQSNEYLVVRACDSSWDDYEPDQDLNFFIREFNERQVAASTIVPAFPVWLSINRLMGKGITALRLKRQLSTLLS